MGSTPQHPPVLILLAAYNGAAWLAEQLESIRRQTLTSWRVLIRDDGSSDHTLDIIRNFTARDERIGLLSDSRGRLGVTHNFAALAEAALSTSARYIAFADQDDVWHDEKLARQLACLETAEHDSAPGTPIAVHSDLAVVDSHLQPIHSSFLKYQGIWHEPDRPLRTLVVQNFVTGCTLLVNRPSLELAVPFPPEALVHDWWLALCAAAAGRLEFLPHPTVLYRQHGRNAVGAKRWWLQLLPKLRQLVTRGQSLIETIDQAAALRVRLLQHAQGIENQRFLDTYSQLVHADVRHRLRQVSRLAIRRQGGLRNILMFAQWGVVRCDLPSAGPTTRRPNFASQNEPAGITRPSLRLPRRW